MIYVKTYEDFMNNYKTYLPKDMDMREGTLAHMVMSATAMAMAQVYQELVLTAENAFGATATGSWLDKAVAPLGLTRRPAGKAVVKIEGDTGLKVGDKVTAGELAYEITQLADTYYVALCTTEGEAGNSYIGEVLPEEGSEAVSLQIVSVISPGCDIEDDESLQRRYVERILTPVCTGNVSYYKEAIQSLDGVGGIKVEPSDTEAGLVKVIITDSEHNTAGDELVAYVKEYLDPAEYSGKGYGVVPIGHHVAVESAESVDINVTVDINQSGNPDLYMRYARPALKKLIKELNKNWSTSDNIVIWNRLIEDYLFTYDGVWDVKVNAINDDVCRLILGENQIVGEVTINGS